MKKESRLEQEEKSHHSIYEAFLTLKTASEVKDFLSDLCTPNEILVFKERWLSAQLLEKGELTYRQISEKIGASTTTVGRVARYLNDKNCNGYKIAIERLNKNGK